MNTETALVAYINARTRQNRDNLITAYWYLCIRGAKKFYRSGGDRSDLIQTAAIGLIKAVEHYDPFLRTPFEAYAWLLIVGELMHYVRDHERSMRLPRPLRALEKHYLRISERLSTELGRPPTSHELARELGVDLATIDELRVLRRGGAVVSLEAVTGSVTGELPASADGLSLVDRLALLIAVEQLTERERIVVLGSFAAGLTQAEIGQRLGLSQSQVSKLIKKALLEIQRKVA
jgi:RNA polymerase sigma-B factor